MLGKKQFFSRGMTFLFENTFVFTFVLDAAIFQISRRKLPTKLRKMTSISCYFLSVCTCRSTFVTDKRLTAFVLSRQNTVKVSDKKLPKLEKKKIFDGKVRGLSKRCKPQNKFHTRRHVFPM